MDSVSSPAKKKTSLGEAPSKADQLLLPYLPQYIITNHILTLLPVQTLIRFKCVCKLWLYLILSTNFIEAHLSKSSRLKDSSHHRIIFKRRLHNLSSYNYYPHSITSSPIDSLFHPQTDDKKSVKYLSDTWMSIVGSCNGLVCLAINFQATLLWNPSTRESKRLPELDGNLEKSRATMFGFGYDQLSDDYKVFMTRFFNAPTQVVDEVVVYSLKTNLWRKIENFFPRPIVQCQAQGVFVNGILHWAVGTSDYFSSRVIVSFHLGKETYGEFEQPNFGDGDFRWCLTMLEEYLSLFCYNFVVGCIDIWVMKEYGTRDSWIKMHSVKHMIIQNSHSQFQYIPLCIFISDIIFFKFQSGFIRYDLNHGVIKKSAIHDFSSWTPDFMPTTYIESLVSPNTYNQHGILCQQ